MYTCVQCNKTEVSEEFQRCPSCAVSHKELCAKLDARPRTHIKKVKEQLFPIKEMKGGISVTTYISREDAVAMGIQLPQ